MTPTSLRSASDTTATSSLPRKHSLTLHTHQILSGRHSSHDRHFTGLRPDMTPLAAVQGSLCSLPASLMDFVATQCCTVEALTLL
ncbi:hypothetical protein E2C01_000193 [Portunus trituberculatus]|uniref:Uncharacterized protein n=1 Tax=Portunus trituberculatus TaxID=210409 RepID=A0A5B7CDN2_PORTR|nr:hypothetical protein [Portunus trituberculatus]